MKHTQRFLAAVAAVLLAFSLASCGSDTTSSQEPSSTPTTTAAPQPYALYKAGVDKQKAMTSYHALMQMKMRMEMPGMTMDISADVDMNWVKEGDKERANILTSTKALGMDQKSTTYMDGDTLYMSMNQVGEDMKYKMKLTDAISGGEVPYTQVEFPELTEESLQNTVVTTVDGKTTITGTLPSETLQTVMKDMMVQFENEMLPVDPDTQDEEQPIRFSDMEIAVCLNEDGYLTECSYKFDMTMKQSLLGENETEMKTVMDMTIKIPNPGEAVTVTPPADLDSYVDYGEIMGSGSDPDPEMVAYEIAQMLYDENRNKVEDYDEQYQRLVMAYGEDVVEDAMQRAQQLLVQWAILEALYNENGEKVDNYDEQYQRMTTEYGKDAVEEAVQYAQQYIE